MSDTTVKLPTKRYHGANPASRMRTQQTGADMRTRVIEAFDQSWRDGKTFSIYLNNEGEVEVRKNGKIIHKYLDAGDAIYNLFPDAAQKL